MKLQALSPRQESEWPWPRGKYQTSPGSKSLVSERPSGSTTVVRTRPSRTNAHSAAVACQCSSRVTPGSRRIETPAMPLEIGSSSTVASLPKLPSMTLPRDFSSENLNVGNSFPDSSGSGVLFLNGKSDVLPVCDIRGTFVLTKASTLGFKSLFANLHHRADGMKRSGPTACEHTQM